MPHRVTHRRRYRISNDILMVILDKLNPVTLYRTCQVRYNYANLMDRVLKHVLGI